MISHYVLRQLGSNITEAEESGIHTSRPANVSLNIGHVTNDTEEGHVAWSSGYGNHDLNKSSNNKSKRKSWGQRNASPALSGKR